MHMAASAVTGAGAWLVAGPTAGMGLILFGSLLDIDHIEHYAGRGMPMNPLDLLNAATKDQKRLERRYGFRRGVPSSWGFPVLHSVELMILATGVGLLSGSLFVYGAAAGILLHILMDLRAYPISPRFFSILWRRRHWVRLRMTWKTWNA